jgi:serine/threonine protein kinase
MAPELHAGIPYDEKIDIFSFAIIMWQLASGKYPFPQLSPDKYLRIVQRGGYRPKLSNIFGHGIRQPFADLIAKCWSGEPEDRFSSRDIVSFLQHVINQCDATVLNKKAFDSW